MASLGSPTGAQASSSAVSFPSNLPASSQQVPSSSASSLPPPPQTIQHHIPEMAPSSIASAPAATTSRPTASTTTAATHISPHLPAPPSSQREIAEARAAVVASLGNLVDSELQSRASLLHANAAALARQEHDLLRATDALRRENDRLGRVAEDAGRRVKLLGNVQNWAEVLERDFLVLEETVRLSNRAGCGDSCCSCSEGDGGSWSQSEPGEREGGEVDEDDAGKGQRMVRGLDIMGRKFDEGNGESRPDDSFGTRKAAAEGEQGEEMEADGYGSHTAFSDTSRSVAEGESMNGTDSRAKEPDTTSLSTPAGR